jgi:tetratricopeptide (TPR) repeat protein
MSLWSAASFGIVLLAVTGCASFQAKTELHHGRLALLRGMPQTAVPHLEQATLLDGESVVSPLHVSAWTYLGRANYEAKKYPPARQALERAVALNNDDGLARLYLGLTLARESNAAAGHQEILGGLKSLDVTLNHIVYGTSSGPYWDPSGTIRKELNAAQVDLAAVQLRSEEMLARLEFLGVTIEQEIDKARRDESTERRHNSGGDM